MTAVTPMLRRPSGVAPLADTGSYQGGPRYVCGFVAPSSSGGTPHAAYYDLAQGCWVCSCTGNTHHGRCRHLDRHDLSPDLRALGKRGVKARPAASAPAGGARTRAPAPRVPQRPVVGPGASSGVFGRPRAVPITPVPVSYEPAPATAAPAPSAFTRAVRRVVADED